jgi:U4/U6.U5 tri-snRNP-associated protein 2
MKREREEDEENGDAPDSAQKRVRGDGKQSENGEQSDQARQEPSVTPGADAEATETGDEEGDDRIFLPRSTSRAAVKKGIECPYLDTVSRQVGVGDDCGRVWPLFGPCMKHFQKQNPGLLLALQNLDFDFEKCCSITLSHVNVYVCLVCGKYFQVRSTFWVGVFRSSLTSHHHDESLMQL